MSFVKPEPVSLFVVNTTSLEILLSKYFWSSTCPGRIRKPGIVSPTALIALIEVKVSQVSG
jgi:hypothetical protein